MTARLGEEGAGDSPLDDVASLLRQAVSALDALDQEVASRREIPSELVRLAEAVSLARSELYTALVQLGWITPGAAPDAKNSGADGH